MIVSCHSSYVSTDSNDNKMSSYVNLTKSSNNTINTNSLIQINEMLEIEDSFEYIKFINDSYNFSNVGEIGGPASLKLMHYQNKKYMENNIESHIIETYLEQYHFYLCGYVNSNTFYKLESLSDEPLVNEWLNGIDKKFNRYLTGLSRNPQEINLIDDKIYFYKTNLKNIPMICDNNHLLFVFDIYILKNNFSESYERNIFFNVKGSIDGDNYNILNTISIDEYISKEYICLSNYLIDSLNFSYSFFRFNAIEIEYYNGVRAIKSEMFEEIESALLDNIIFDYKYYYFDYQKVKKLLKI